MNNTASLVGHEQVVLRFNEALAQGRMHHAWLLYGMKGIGKRMLAEQLAALLMCESRSACGQCHGCKMLAVGSHPDVVRVGLIEGKRDVNIEQVRALLGFLSLSSSEGERRVVILDDAERLNHQAANALLKGLEEPASGSVLLMVCADLDRLPATIRSRCMLQQCMPLPEPGVRKVLEKMFVDTKGNADTAILELAVSLADGCPGVVGCLQEKKLADALLRWRQLIVDPGNADVGQVDDWIRQYVALVPHTLIVRMLLTPLYPLLQNVPTATSFAASESLHRAAHDCARWPADVVRSSLRAAPTLLACVLALRTAIKAQP
ncbi:MAG: AAA family ATPase [Mariprofundus sp.]